ncbi:MAG: DDE-type integrase/transposase/recombinase [Nitrospirae bacterium]|nr:DDE-type integrase/transposase/recombinase [Nitrospirota bacterium]
MRKLNLKKIRWIIRKKKEGFTNQRIAMGMKISKRRVIEVWSEYRKTGNLPVLNKAGRKRKELTEKQKELICRAYKQYYLGPTGLEKVIQRKSGVHIPHNAIYRFMAVHGLVEENKNKKKQRKWVRYERKHSLSLVHTDWSEFQGKQVIAFVDDASRMVIACGEFSNATEENSIAVLLQAIEFAKPYGGIRQLISDHGTQFTAPRRDKDGFADHGFEKILAESGIEQIFARVKHPQTNGKLERWFYTYQTRRNKFASLSEFLHWYNDMKPHMSLNFNKAETPSEAFIRKLKTELWLGYVKEWFD